MSIRQRLQSLHAEVREHLEQGIIPFWANRAPDRECGGYLTNFDEKGEHYGTPEKYLNSQCRLLWWFSRLARTRPEASFAAFLAKHGADFLIQHYWDEQFGGWAWKTHRDGSELDPAKIVYGQSFAIYAFSEYSLATKDPRGLEYASRTFDLLQKYAADTLHGGYYENLNRDWSPESPGFAGGDRKGLDTHMHLMEAFTTLYAASGQDIHRRKLLQITDLICQKMIDPVAGCGLNQFDIAFRSLPALGIKRTWNAERFGERPADPTDTTSYGHNVELAWLMTRALETANAPLEPYHPYLRRLLDHALQHGVDWEFGGIYRDGLRHAGPLVLEKEFWQHAECLVGFLGGYETFSDARYLDAFDKIWAFVRDHMIIRGVGEWRTLLERQGKPIDPKIGNCWKVSYHTGRAAIECTERLEKLMG